ncbi:replication initiator [Nocardioides jiangxiensis]|uniref:Replication initiation protein n=1 Tax=Nocardioides jiangxiensis TaxID=3064524 RepID=A0ABT9B2I1_9ACTN|nr:replication initiator [Nocardioides sp. WY-20]MDO7868529.1 hypothetical protein [Nocardioides sp. WY-20]
MGVRSRSDVVALLPRLLPDALPGLAGDAIPDLPRLSHTEQDRFLEQLRSQSVGDFADALAKVGGCSHPIRLVGSSMRVDAATGEVVSSFASKDQELGVVYVPCGNRRTSKCPACAWVYAGDTYWLIKTGICGGRTVPDRVTENPMVFATFTAPSFGAVHGRRDAGACRPRRGECEHGRPLGCHRHHAEDDELLGQPLCRDCYDYTSHLIWQWHAGELWQRFNMAIKRAVAKHLGVPGSKVTEHACVQYGKVAELQARGAIHFHGLLRLDGPKTTRGYEPAPAGIDAVVLCELIKEAAASVRLEVPGATPDDVRRVLAFGAQIDVRTVHPGSRVDDPDGPLTANQVAKYVAKYASKAASDDAKQNDHFQRLRATAYALAERTRDAAEDWCARGETPPRYGEMSRWAHELGYHGHFASKSHVWGLTRTQLRRARQRVRILEEQARRTGEVLDLAAREAELYAKEAVEDETTVVIAEWQYAGTGWANDAQTTLAIASAAAAREYAREEAAERRTTHNNSEKGTR